MKNQSQFLIKAAAMGLLLTAAPLAVQAATTATTTPAASSSTTSTSSTATTTATPAAPTAAQEMTAAENFMTNQHKQDVAAYTTAVTTALQTGQDQIADAQNIYNVATQTAQETYSQNVAAAKQANESTFTRLKAQYQTNLSGLQSEISNGPGSLNTNDLKSRIAGIQQDLTNLPGEQTRDLNTKLQPFENQKAHAESTAKNIENASIQQANATYETAKQNAINTFQTTLHGQASKFSPAELTDVNQLITQQHAAAAAAQQTQTGAATAGTQTAQSSTTAAQTAATGTATTATGTAATTVKTNASKAKSYFIDRFRKAGWGGRSERSDRDTAFLNLHN
jgi:hypothetical protein